MTLQGDAQNILFMGPVDLLAILPRIDIYGNLGGVTSKLCRHVKSLALLLQAHIEAPQHQHSQDR